MMANAYQCMKCFIGASWTNACVASGGIINGDIFVAHCLGCSGKLFFETVERIAMSGIMFAEYIMGRCWLSTGWCCILFGDVSVVLL